MVIEIKDLIRDHNWKRASKAIKPDSRKRVTLPTTPEYEVDSYVVFTNSLGQIILDPQVIIPASEKWVFENPEILELAKEGLKAAAEGRVSKLDLDNL